MTWHKSLQLKAKSKATGKEFTIRDAFMKTIDGRKEKWYSLIDEETGQEWRMPESLLDIDKGETDAKKK